MLEFVRLAGRAAAARAANGGRRRAAGLAEPLVALAVVLLLANLVLPTQALGLGAGAPIICNGFAPDEPLPGGTSPSCRVCCFAAAMAVLPPTAGAIAETTPPSVPLTVVAVPMPRPAARTPRIRAPPVS